MKISSMVTVNGPGSHELETTEFCGYHSCVRGEFRLIYELLSCEELSGCLSLTWWGYVTEKFMVFGSRDRSVQVSEVREYIAEGKLSSGSCFFGLVGFSAAVGELPRPCDSGVVTKPGMQTALLHWEVTS